MTSSTHEPADCELAACDRCDSYGDGYAAGKDAAYFAISTWELGAHASDCGCRCSLRAAGRAHLRGPGRRLGARRAAGVGGRPGGVHDNKLND